MKLNEKALISRILEQVSALKSPSTFLQLSSPIFSNIPVFLSKKCEPYGTFCSVFSLPELQTHLLKSLKDRAKTKETCSGLLEKLLNELDGLEKTFLSSVKKVREFLMEFLEKKPDSLETLLEDFECGSLNDDAAFLERVKEFCRSGHHLMEEKALELKETFINNLWRKEKVSIFRLENFCTLEHPEVMSFDEFNWLGGVLSKRMEKIPKISILFDAKRDGFEACDFHSRCDNKGPTLTVTRTKGGKVLGGFASNSWRSTGDWVAEKDPQAFLFSVTHKEIYEQYKDKEHAVYQYIAEGPTFGSRSDLLLRLSVRNKKARTDPKKISYGIFSSTYDTKKRTAESISDQEGYFEMENYLVFKVSC